MAAAPQTISDTIAATRHLAMTNNPIEETEEQIHRAECR
jgi:hypothetical protein